MENHDLHTKFRSVSEGLRAQRHRHGHGGPEDPTRGQGRILAALKLQDGLPTKDLAYVLGLRVASLNELLGKLEKSGLVTREPSDRDKRVTLIRLTEEGRAAEQDQPENDDAFAVLSEEERERLGSYLDRILDRLGEHSEDRGEEFERWSEAARARMGDERFDRWMEKFEDRFGGFGGQFAGRRGPWGGGPRGGGPRGRGPAGFGGDLRGQAPQGWGRGPAGSHEDPSGGWSGAPQGFEGDPRQGGRSEGERSGGREPRD